MTKAQLRTEARARLAALASRDRDAASERIARAVWALPALAGARTLLLYAATPFEVDTDAIAHEAWRRGMTVLYPRCAPDEPLLRLHRTSAHRLAEELRVGAFGLREPDPDRCAEVEPALVDVALVPGLGWDRRGHRLGRGAGYFDRLLAHPAWRAARVGLFFAAQEFTRIPHDPWDVALDAVVTERETIVDCGMRNAE